MAVATEPRGHAKRKAILGGVSAGIIASLVAAGSHAAGANTSASLAAAIGEKCKASALRSDWGGGIDAADLYAVLVKLYPIVIERGADNGHVFTAIANATGGPAGIDAKSTNGSNELVWGQLIVRWIRNGLVKGSATNDPFKSVALVSSDGQPIPATDALSAIEELYGAKDSGLVFLCKPSPKVTLPPAEIAGNGSKVPSSAAKPKLTIAQSNATLGATSDAKKAGQVGFVDNIAQHSISASTQIAIGVNIPLSQPPKADEFRSVSLYDDVLTPYVYYDRQGTDKTSDKSYTNILSFGFQNSGYINFRSGGAPRESASWATYYSISGYFQTDDRLKSRVFGASGTLMPIVPIPGNQVNYYFNDANSPLVSGFEWSVGGAADFAKVDYPWVIPTLQKTPQYGRIGYDLSATFFVGPNPNTSSWKVNLEADYSRRHALTDQGGSVGLFTAKLMYQINSNFGFGLVYQDGNDLLSLAPLNQLTFTFTAKQ